MLAGLHPMDAHSRASDLAATIHSASTAPEIAAACSAATAFLRRHPHAFFSVAFPALVCRLFGFASSPPSPAWIDQPPSSPAAADLLSLLSPTGPLFAAAAAADASPSPAASVRYVFPLERLPDWIRLSLQTNAYSPTLADLCPLLKGRVMEDKLLASYQVHLKILEYYFFWFAYYPVCKGNTDPLEPGAASKPRRFWTEALPVLSRRTAPKTECGIYLQLLYAYLTVFVPKCGAGAYQPYRSSLLHYDHRGDDSVFRRAEFFVYTLVHFWLVDNDFSPLPVNVCRSFGVVFPFRSVVAEIPPTAGLGDAVKLLVKYMNCGLIAASGGDERKVFDKSPVRKADDAGKAMVISLENSFGAWNSVMQRPLYRFILRTFLFCPVGASVKNASQVFEVWVAYITPWKTNPEDFSEFEFPGGPDSEGRQKESSSNQLNSKEGKGGSQMRSVYEPIWQGYVLSNYVFYSSLVVHFLGFAHKFLHDNVESMIQMVSKLLDILTSSKELLDLLQKVDTAYHSKQAGPSSSYHDSLYKYVPAIREQLLDWEDGLHEHDADGTFLHENWNLDLKLFSDAEQGARKLLQFGMVTVVTQLFILRAEHEIQSITGDVSQNLQALDSIRSKMNILLGDSVEDSWSRDSPEKAHVLDHGRAEVFTPKHPGLGKRKWADLKYNGDWMRRPISDNEVAWLAAVLVRLSDWLNKSLALDQVDISETEGPVVVNMAYDEAEHIGGAKEVIYMVGGFLGSWLGPFCQSVLRYSRRHGMRINLRWLASKKVVMVLACFVVFLVLNRAFLAVFPASTSV